MNSLIKTSMRAAVSGVPVAPACPFCANRQTQNLAQGQPDLFQCPECGSHFWTANAPSRPMGETAPTRSSRYYEARTAWIRDYLGYAPRRILDLECGEGTFLKEWPWTARRDGIEADSQSAAVAMSHGLRVFNGSISEADPSGPYDIITWYQGSESNSKYDATVKRVAPWIHQGGVLAIGLPTLECRLHRMGLAPADKGWFEHVAGKRNFPSRDWLEQILERHGFLRVAESWTDGGLSARRPLAAWTSERGLLTAFSVFDYYEAVFRKL